MYIDGCDLRCYIREMKLTTFTAGPCSHDNEYIRSYAPKLCVQTITARFCTFGSVEICLKNNVQSCF